MKTTLHNFITQLLFISIILLVFSCGEEKNNSKINKPEISGNLFNKFDPSKVNPTGKQNPQAPSETSQFEFMIGEFTCIDSMMIKGKWVLSNASWTSEYILNGYGIKDSYISDKYSGTSIRFFNTKKQKWDVYFFGMPGEHTGLWEGEQIDGKMIMRQKRKGSKGQNLESRLTFYSINNNSFKWKSELWNLDQNTLLFVEWKISAKRKK